MITHTACPVCRSNSFQPFLKSKDYFLTKQEFTIVCCSDCGFKFTNPRPDDSVLGDYYKSEAYISHSNTSKGLVAKLYQSVRNYTLGSKESLLREFVSRGTLLDYGCGSGHFIKFCGNKGWKVSGIEPDEGAREQAKKHVESVFSSKEELIKKSSNLRYSAISLWHVLEHLGDLHSVMHFLSETLEEQGVLFVALPNPNSYDAKKYREYWAAYDLPRHLYHFDENSLALLFDTYGFVKVATRPMYFDSFYVSLLSEKYKTGKTSLLKAILIGAFSNLKAIANGQFSSRIYIFKHKTRKA